MPVTLDTIKLLMPVIILGVMAVWIYVGGAFRAGRMGPTLWSSVALASYIAAALALAGKHAVLWGEDGPLAMYFPTGPVSIDLFGQMISWLALLAGVIFTLLAAHLAPRPLISEYCATLMVLVAGVMLVGMANDLVMLFVGLEAVSIPTYILLYLGRRERATSEAAVKYFFLSIFASALLLYGLSFLYGIGGTTVLTGSQVEAEGATVIVNGLREELLTQASAGQQSGLLSLTPIALVLILAGLGFKVAAAPFHFYAPDVYQGATSANAGLLAVAPKIAGFAAFVKLGNVFAAGVDAEFAWRLTIVVSILTMTIGNVCALWQQNIRRLLAYSSIAHSGYLFIGLAVALAAPVAPAGGDITKIIGGVSAVVFYLFVYALATAGAFAVLALLSSTERELSGVKELAGLSRTHPLAAAALAICLLSLTGLPPLAGFWGKFSLFNSAIGLAVETDVASVRIWFAVLATVGVLNAAVAAAYYLRVAASMYFGERRSEVTPQSGDGLRLAAGFCAVAVVVVGLFPGRFFQYANLAERAANAPLPVTSASKISANANVSTANRRE